MASPLAWQKLAPAVRLASGRSGADQRAGRVRRPRPYGAYHFGHVQVYFVLANMIAVPLTAMWVMPAGLIALLLMPVHLEALALVPMGWGAQAMVWVARSDLRSARRDDRCARTFRPGGLCVFSVGLAWLGLWQTRRRLAGIVLMLVGLASPLLDRPPDLLISDDGRLIAVRTPQGAFLQQTQGGSKFTRDAWAQYWAVGVVSGDATRSRARGSRNSATTQRCRPGPITERRAYATKRYAASRTPACCGPIPTGPARMLVRGAQHPDFCDQVSVIVSAEPARGLCPRPWPKLVDRFTVWRYGSAAIWLERTVPAS